MRRRDREITDRRELLEVIGRAKVCRIAFNDKAFPYVIPLNFGYEAREEKIFLYLHGALEGRKIDLLRQDPHIGFEMDGKHRLLTSADASSYSYAYESVIGTGKARLADSIEEKRHGLNCLMMHQAGLENAEFPETVINRTAVIEIEVIEISGKRNLPPESK